MQEITSVNNDLVKQTVKLQQKKYRDKENKFLLEGMKCIEEAYQAGVDIFFNTDSVVIIIFSPRYLYNSAFSFKTKTYSISTPA